MASPSIEKNNVDIDNTTPGLKIDTYDTYDTSDTSDTSVVTDVITILDKSGSMFVMGNEPIQAVNAFIEEQKNNYDDGATFTLVMFSNVCERLYDNVPIFDMKTISNDSYHPTGGTALNDAVCCTITTELVSKKPDHKVVVIITDGKENHSRLFTTTDTKRMIKDCQDNHDWKFIFIGANIDSFAEGYNINVGSSQCGQFVQGLPGDLLQMCRQTSSNINSYRRARTEGYEIPDLIAAPSMAASVSHPYDEKEREVIIDMLGPDPLHRINSGTGLYVNNRSELQSPLYQSLKPSPIVIPTQPPVLERSIV
jgi:hypothetical protein